MRTVEYTHSGWFWFCPIYFAFDGDGNCAAVEARYEWLEWLFTACEFLEQARIGLSSSLWEDYEPSFQFKVKPLKKPFIRTEA